MIDLFKHFNTFLKFENISTDNIVFRMHYKLTVTILICSAVIVTSKQFFGEPIHCMNNMDKEIDKDAMNNFCWIYGTYTSKRLDGARGKDAYPGIGPKGKDDVVIKHSYYQWVCFMLVIQSFMFYIPRYLWKFWEGGRLKALASGLASPIVSKDWSEFRRSELLSYLSYANMHTHNKYALRHAFCEILNLINVIGQIFLIDVFLGGNFRNYGTAVAAFSRIPNFPTNMIDDSHNPMDQFFPKITRCLFTNYGPSGSPQIKDRLCVLPLNIINEKIFVVLWFWLIILTIASSLSVLFRVLVLSLRQLRTSLIMGQLENVNRSQITRIVKRLEYGDWFILYLLGKNMNPLIYRELVNELAKNLDQKSVSV